jgi:hypothetical protein
MRALFSVLFCLFVAVSPANSQPWLNPTASDGGSNTAGGTNALLNTTGGVNTAFGDSALLNNREGFSNTANGAFALSSNTVGYYNTASGDSALRSNTTGVHNTANGAFALSSNTAGYYNTASGDSALRSNTTGVHNTANGVKALQRNTTGNYNTATGAAALLFNTTGTGNTGYGLQALRSNDVGHYNTAVGYQTLVAVKGYRNTALGWGAGNLLTSGSDNIYVGHPGVATESSTLRLGDLQTRAFIKGVAGVSLSGNTVVINSAGQLGVQAASAAETILPDVLQVVEAQQQQIELLQDRVTQQAQQIEAILRQLGK